MKISASGWAGDKVARSGRSISPHPQRKNVHAWREQYIDDARIKKYTVLCRLTGAFKMGDPYILSRHFY